MSILLRTPRLSQPLKSGSFFKPRMPHHVPKRHYNGYGYGYNNEVFHNIRLNNAILWGCIGTSVAVWGSWQYAFQQSRSRMTDIFTGALSSRSWKIKCLNFLNEHFMISWDHIRKGYFWTLITSAFSHQSASHLIGNMFSLYTFGSMLLMTGMSPFAYATILFGSAVAGNIGFLYHAAYNRTNTHGLGASGMVMGAGSALALLAPGARVLAMGVVPVPIALVLAGYVAYDSYYLDDPMSMVGHSAHLSGAAFGAACYAVFLRRFGGVFGRFK